MARKFGTAIPDLGFSLDKIVDPYNYDEGWRVNVANESIQRLRENGEDDKAELVEEAKDLMVECRQSDLAKLVLKYRCMYNYSYLPDDETLFKDKSPDVVAFQIEMFRVNVSITKDRLFGVWGVPMDMKNIKLDYDKPMEAWRKVVRAYPFSNFAYYTRENDPDQKRLLGFQSFAEVETLVACLLSDGDRNKDKQYIVNPKPAKVIETTTHSFYQDSDGDTSFTLAWGEDYVGFACKKGCKEALSPETGPFHFVVAYDTLRVTDSGSPYFSFYLSLRSTVGPAFGNLVNRLVKLGLCKATWEQAHHIEHVVATTLRKLVDKHQQISKYRHCFGFEKLHR